MCKIIIVLGILRVIAAAHLPILQLDRSAYASSRLVITPEVEKQLAMLRNTSMYENGTDCFRPCKEQERRICYQRFHLENYQAMGAACGECSRGRLIDCFNEQCVAGDGIERGILTINRQIPGPLLKVCRYDLMVIDLYNNMHSESTSIHWHGILQRETPYMDGVPFVTQCPIHPSNRFRYTFWVEEYGTYFYHSHSGVQRYSGAYGGLIVRRESDTLSKYYDKDEHEILIGDYSHEASEMFTVGLPTRPPGLLPESILINGMGKYFINSGFSASPYETLSVTAGLRYRFRIINAGSTVCPLQIQIQDHNMTIISSDGDDVKPVTVNTLYIATGERYDVVVHANKRSGMYWFHARAVGLCTPLNVYQLAILSYIPDSEKTGALPIASRNAEGFTRGRAINDPDAVCGRSTNELCLTDLSHPNPDIIYTQKPNRTLYLTFSIRQMNTARFFDAKQYVPFFNIRDNDIFLGTINGLSFKPTSYPILSQGRQIDPSLYCNTDRIPARCKNQEICTCNHIYTVGFEEHVEIVFIDESPDTIPVIHPIHPHGFKCAVVAQGRLPGNTSLTVERIKELDRAGLIKRNLRSPVMKDTIAVQNQGYVIIRIIAINPGAWLQHCHVEDHMVFGMGVVMMVAGKLNPVPVDFPKCGNFPI